MVLESNQDEYPRPPEPGIYERLREKYPEVANREAINVKSQISGILKKMTTNRQLFVVKEPHGGYPAEYRKPTVGEAVVNVVSGINRGNEDE
jgi:hypothetical protein